MEHKAFLRMLFPQYGPKIVCCFFRILRHHTKEDKMQAMGSGG